MALSVGALSVSTAQAQSGTSSVSTNVSLFLAGGNTYTITPAGGGGSAPGAISLLAGTGRVLTLTATGAATFCPGSTCGTPSPDGPSISNTNINSSGSIAGLVSPSSGFLAALFLGNSLPGTAPAPLNLTSIDFLTLSPLLGQTFFVGNGLTSSMATQQFFVPDGATRLYFGIVDGYGFNGDPGYYDDNLGKYDVTYNVSNVSAVPEPSTYALLAAGLAGIAAVRRRRR